MRKLGQALGVEAMSLYNHVANKDDVLDGMVDLVLAEIEVPPADARTGRRRCAAGRLVARRVRAPPWACSLLIRVAEGQRLRMQWMEAVLGTLPGGRLLPDLTHHAYHALDSHITASPSGR